METFSTERQEEESPNMRRTVILALAAMTMIGLLAAPAGAGKPTELGPFSDTFPETDPCTGGPMEVTLVEMVYLHDDHKNNFVVRVQRSGTTDVGYEMLNGQDKFIANKGGERANFKDVWRNPETGQKMQASGAFRMVGNSPVVDSFNLRCVGGPTLP